MRAQANRKPHGGTYTFNCTHGFIWGPLWEILAIRTHSKFRPFQGANSSHWPQSPDFFHLIPSTLKIWLKLESRLSFLCSDSWILICHPVLFSPLSLFSLENLPCPWPDTSSCPQILLTKEPVPLARCLYATTCVVISVGGFLFSSGVSTSLEQILQAQFDINPNYTRVCLGMRSN